MEWEPILRWTGGIFQIAGVITIALGVGSRRVTLGKDGIWHRTKRWTRKQWRRLTGKPPIITAVGGATSELEARSKRPAMSKPPCPWMPASQNRSPA